MIDISMKKNGPTEKAGFMVPLIFALMMLWAGQSFADDGRSGGYYGTAGGGFTGPSPASITVEQAKNMRDDAKVVIRGHIIQNLGGEDYMFKDASGTVIVEIDEKRWAGQSIGPEDLVEIHGEVDKDLFKVEIEVDRVLKQ